MTDRPDSPAASPFHLFTIGHSNHPIERFMTLLQEAGVTAVADVRSQPVSRRYPWFSAARLREALVRHGIAYVPVGEALGGRPRDPRLFRDGIADYDAMAATPEFRAGIDRVVAGMERFCIALMCAERDPLDCHRCLLVAPALAARGVRIGHILADGSIVAHTIIEERLLALARGDDLFDDPAARRGDAYRRRAMAVAYRRKA
jgi:uncharacterized protein (DUF488 family)